MDQTIKAFNLKIDLWTKQKTINEIEQNLITRKSVIIQTSLNSAKVVNAQKDRRLRDAVNESDIVNIDGYPLVLILRLMGYNVPGRIAGIDLFNDLLSLSADKGYKVYLLGAKQPVIDKVIERLSRNFPSLKIVGYRNGYFEEKEEKNLVETIRSATPDMLFLGITSPKKEIFLEKYKAVMQIPFCMGVGGSFDILAGKVNRAPRWMQKSGLEWFYRLCQEPGRLWKRYLLTNTEFILLSFREIFKHYVKKLR